jgi:hypothetical protein
MELINQLPVKAFAFRQFDQNGELDCVVAVRATFMHKQDSALKFCDEQEAFQWTDTYEGDPHASILLRQTDLTPQKLGTDVTFLGTSFAPGGQEAKSWTCGIQVGPVKKTLAIHGERHWHPIFRTSKAPLMARPKKPALEDWRLGVAKPASSMSIDWTRAFGGAVPGTGDPDRGVPADVEPSNPIGCGIVDTSCRDELLRLRAPSVTAPEDKELNWRTKYEPQGFGLVSPWWRARQRHAGTYDARWQQDRHPLLPEDFDPRFWQCGHPDLIAYPHLAGGESFQLTNLHPLMPVARGLLPDVTLGVHLEREDRDEWHVANLDGVHFDWRSDDRVLLTWRARFPLPEAGDTRLTLDSVVFSDVAHENSEAAE